MFINDRKTDRKKNCRYHRDPWIGLGVGAGRKVHTPGHAEGLEGGNAFGQNVPRRRDYCAEILAEQHCSWWVEKVISVRSFGFRWLILYG